MTTTAWRANCSPEYLAAYDRHNAACTCYGISCRLYREGRITDAEFDKAAAGYKKETAAYDAAYRKEQKNG